MNIDKLKIFVLVGSMRGEKSVEFKTIMNFLQCKEFDNAIIDYLSVDKVNVENCLGCCKCFNTGICPLDKKDDMGKIKQKLIDADLIIISSPVYLHHVSGATKTLLDRISYWAHIFRLIGKRAVVCSSTEVSGNEYVISYLKKAMTSFGCYVVGELTCYAMQTKDELNENFNKIIYCLIESIEDPTICRPTTFQNELFYTLKAAYLSESNNYEADYWKENDMFKYYSFEEFSYSKLGNNIKV